MYRRLAMKSKRFVSLSILAGLSIGLFAGAITAKKTSNNVVAANAYYTPSTHYEVSNTPEKLASYYSSIHDSDSGTALLSSLQSLNGRKRRSTVGYGGVGTSISSSACIYTDYDLNYTATDSNGQTYGTKVASFYTKTSATSWNREHMWPNSHGGNKVEGDILHTRPTISTENSSRGNSFYVEGMNSGSAGWDPYTAGYAEWVRGECARIILYSVVAYSGFTLSDLNSHSTSNSNPDYMMGNMNTLIKWHFAYTPNEYEMNRNNGAEYLQGNRNPFVDHPEYVARIWSDFNSTVSTLCTNNASVYSGWTPGNYSTYGTNDASGSSTTGINLNKYSVTLAVDGTTNIVATSSNGGTINWTTSDSTIASISSSTSASGTEITITGESEGTAYIAASQTIDETPYSKVCTVTVSNSGGGGDIPEPGDYTLVTSNSMLSNGDHVVVKTAADIGVTGWNNNKDATTSSNESDWKKYEVKNASGSGWKLYDADDEMYIATPTDNHFKYDTNGGTCSADSEGHLKCGNRYLCVNGSNYRFYSSVTNYVPFFIYKVNEQVPQDPVVESISVSSAPSKTSYFEGEYFDPTGLVINRYYTDGSDDTYTYAGHESEFLFSPSLDTALTIADTEVDISYDGFECSQPIDVAEEILPPVVLDEISVNTAPTKIAYEVGEYFNPQGLIINRHYSDGSTDTLDYDTDSSGFIFTPDLATPLQTTHTSVTITYGGFECTQAITVTEPYVPVTLESIGVSTAPSKIAYTEGEYFNPTGLVISRHYSDDSEDTYTYAGHEAEFLFAPALTTALSLSDTSVTIQYEELSCSQPITVSEAVIHVESVSLNYNAVSLTVGETIQLEATVNPTDATNKNVIWECAITEGEDVITVIDGLVTANHAGRATITVRTVDGDFTATCTFEIIERVTPSPKPTSHGCGGSIIATSVILSTLALTGLSIVLIKKNKEK